MTNDYFTKAKPVKEIIDETGDELLYSSRLTEDGRVFSKCALGVSCSQSRPRPTHLSDLDENESVLFHIEVHPRYEISVDGIIACWVNSLAETELSYGNISVFDRLENKFIKI